MIKYTTKDIVVRAKQLADLQNSDFISWNENINLLNENWQKVYQELINNGDKTFIKEFTADVDTKMTLPDDFYELFSVDLVPSCLQIHRKAKSETEKSLAYDIINNEFYLYGVASEKVRVRYFPTPQTLTLKNDTKDINDNMLKEVNYKLLDCCNNKCLYSNFNATNTVKIYNEETNETLISYTVGSTPVRRGVIGKKNSFALMCYEYVNNQNIYIKTSNISSYKNIQINGTEKGCLLKTNNEIGAVKINGSIITMYVGEKEWTVNMSERINGSYDEIGNINLDPLGMASFRYFYDNNYAIVLPVIDENTNKCSYIELAINIDGDDLFVNKSNAFENLDFGLSTDADRNSYLNVIDGKICIASREYFYIDDNPIFSFDDYSIIGVNEINKDTGYGIMIKDTYNTNHVLLHSCFIDTLLLYPNNIFFNFISIMMAMSYKVKQNADITVLEAKLGEMENQYFDSLSRDVNNFVRITNVY